MTTPSYSSEELQAQYERELLQRVDTLEAEHRAAHTNDDTGRFLTALRSANAEFIRQAPGAARRALARTRNPDIGIAQLVSVIEEDPTLGQALLRYANSAYYSTGGGVVVSLKQAAQRIGASGVHNVVLAGMLDGMLSRPGGVYQVMLEQVREHMVRTASVARFLARGFMLPPDDAFALGLLHDAGKLIIFDVIGTMRHDLRRDVQVAMPVLSQCLRALHEPFGGLAALRWGLGPSVAMAIATHHRTPVPDHADRSNELLFIAERVDHALHGRCAVALEAWWQEGVIAGSPEDIEPLLEAYAVQESAAA